MSGSESEENRRRLSEALNLAMKGLVRPWRISLADASGNFYEFWVDEDGEAGLEPIFRARPEIERMLFPIQITILDIKGEERGVTIQRPQ